MPKENSFFFNAKTQHQNLGDALISRELLRTLSSKGTVYVFKGGMPASFLASIQAEKYTIYSSYLRFVSYLIIKSIYGLIARRSNSYFVLNPGGFGNNKNLGVKDKLRQAFLVLNYAVLAVMGVRIMRLGASFGPFTNDRLYFEKLKNAFMYRNTVRDPISLAYAHQNGLKNMSYFPDFALAMPFESYVKGEELASEKPYPYYVVSLRSEDHIYNEYQVNRIKEIAQLNPDVELVFSAQVEFDVEFNKELARTFKQQGLNSRFVECQNEDALFTLYRGAKLVFSNRLHVLLFALRQGVVSIPLVTEGKNKKIIGIFEDLQLTQLIQYVDAPLLSNKGDNIPLVAKELPSLFARKAEQISSILDGILTDES